MQPKARVMDVRVWQFADLVLAMTAVVDDAHTVSTSSVEAYPLFAVLSR
jgi:hypothetical protein